MARFLLVLNCETSGDVTDNEGAFETTTWVSPDGAPVVDPDTAALQLSARNGDQVAFAVGVEDSGGNSQPGWLTWLSATVSASTDPNNRRTRYASNNSPFRASANSTRPLNLLLANQSGAGGTWGFTRYNTDGTPNASGPLVGTPYLTVGRDIPPGQNAPAFSTSKFEATVVASVTDSASNVWQFSYDPEMDVDNGG